MDEKTLTFGDIEIKKTKVLPLEKPYFLEDVNTNNNIVSNKSI